MFIFSLLTQSLLSCSALAAIYVTIRKPANGRRESFLASYRTVHFFSPLPIPSYIFFLFFFFPPQLFFFLGYAFLSHLLCLAFVTSGSTYRPADTTVDRWSRLSMMETLIRDVSYAELPTLAHYSDFEITNGRSKKVTEIKGPVKYCLFSASWSWNGSGL